MLGIGQYTLHAQLPRSGGLYATANVTYRGIQIGKVTAVEPTESGARATMSIDNRYKIPVDASANVHSVSAIGEQFLDLVSDDAPNQYFADGQTITKSTVPAEVGPALDAAERGLAVLPQEKIEVVLDETAAAIGGLGPALQRLVEGTTAIAGDFQGNLGSVRDLIQNSGPILESQVDSGDAIERWSRNLNVLAAQTAEQDAALRSTLEQAAPTADDVTRVFSDTRDALPQALANVAIVADIAKRYNKNLEQLLTIFPQGATVAQMNTSVFPGEGLLHLPLSINQPPPCLTGFLPASEWRAPADTSLKPLASGLYCKIPKDYQGNVVRGARNLPCVDVPGKRAATPAECLNDKPYVPLGTNPWYGDPNQIRNCPAPGARCDQPVHPGDGLIPAPSVNTGLNPLPADQVGGTPSPFSPRQTEQFGPISDPVSRPGVGSVQCSGQQPNPCTYTPADGPTAIYTPQNGEVVTPDGSRFTVESPTITGDDGWKEMLAPTS